MDQNNGLEAKVSERGTRNTLTMGLGEIPPLLIKFSLQGQTWLMGKTIRTMEDHMINAQISHSMEKMEIDPEKNLSTTPMGTGEKIEIFLVLNRLNKETSHIIISIANQELINLTTLLSADLITELRLVSHLTNTKSHKAIIRHHLMLFTSAQFTIPIMNNQIFAHYTTKISELEHR